MAEQMAFRTASRSVMDMPLKFGRSSENLIITGVGARLGCTVSSGAVGHACRPCSWGHFLREILLYRVLWGGARICLT